MRRCPRGITEKGTVFVFLDKLERLICDAGMRIILPSVLPGLLIRHIHAVANEVVGIVVVCVFLVVISKEQVEALVLRYPGRARVAQPPFTKTPGRITGIVQQSGHGCLSSWK